MGRINKTNKATPVSADEFIIYDSEDTSDDKNVTLGQVAKFTEDQDSTVSGTKIFADGVEFQKGNISYGQYASLPTGLGPYTANYVSPTYGARMLAYNGSAYQDLSIGSMPTAGTVSMKSLANGDCNFGYNVNIAEDLGVTGDITANKFIGDGSELTNISGGGLEISALGTITTGVALTAMTAHTAHIDGTLDITLPTTLVADIENVVVFDFTTGSTSQPTITSSRNLTGTCAVTNGDATVTGTSTLFTTELEVGSKITIATVDYQVLSIASNTSLELTANYAGTTASGLTVGHKFIKWSSLNDGKAPTAYSVVSGVRNILTFKTHDSGSTWEAEYKRYGVDEIDLVQPILAQNGTIGSTASVAVSGTWNSGSDFYAILDGNNSSYCGFPHNTPVIISFPKPTKLTSMRMLMMNYYSSSGVWYASNDNSSYTPIASMSSNTSTDYTVSIATQNQGFYRYYKYIGTSGNGTTGFNINELYLTGRQINQNYTT